MRRAHRASDHDETVLMSASTSSPLSAVDRPRAPTPSQAYISQQQEQFSTVTARRSRAQQSRSLSEAGSELVHALSYTPPSSRPHSQHKSSFRQDHYTPPLPDTPAFFRADPYSNAPPSLTSSMSGSASTRSSAYTSPGSTGMDYARVAMPGSDESGDLSDPLHAYALNAGQDVDKLYALERQTSESSHELIAAEASRWSESYTSSTRSRSSSWIGNGSELKTKPSYDWHAHDEREEEILTTDDEAEDDDAFGRAAAVTLAEEGRGLIVHGQGVPVSSLQVSSGALRLVRAMLHPLLIGARRDDASFARVVANSELATGVPHADTPKHQQHPPRIGYFCQLPRRPAASARGMC